jgi:uncharacterized protein YjbI with pentapeptide repeats
MIHPSHPSPQDESSFWKFIRDEKMAKGDFDFYRYTFPNFERTSLNNLFWNFSWQGESNDKTFLDSVSFCRATFLGNANFDRVVFLGAADFSEASFAQEVRFEQADFHRRADFRNVTFSGNSTFRSVKFHDDAHFSYATFMGWADFMATKFSWADFGFTNFHALVSFVGASCSVGSAFIGGTSTDPIKSLVNGCIPSSRYDPWRV